MDLIPDPNRPGWFICAVHPSVAADLAKPWPYEDYVASCLAEGEEPMSREAWDNPPRGKLVAF